MPMQIKFREGRVEQAEIGTHIIGSQHLANNAVSYAAQIKDGIIGYAELTTGLQGSLGGAAPGPNTIGTTQLKEPSVGSSQLYKPAVGSANIYANAVYADKIAEEAVTSGKIGPLAVDNSKIADGAVYGDKIADEAVTSGKIGPLAVDNPKIADEAVDDKKIADNAVTTPKIADASVSEPKFQQHLEFGRMGTITWIRRYYYYRMAFTAPPTVIVCGIGAAQIIDGGVQLTQTPALASFGISKTVAGGTVKGYYMAWGSR